MDYYGNDNNGSGGFQNDPFSPGNDPSFSGGWDNGPSMNGEDPNHHNKNKRSRKPMSPKQKGAIKIVALCLVCALLGGLAQPIYSSLSGGNETTIYTGDRTPTQVDTASVDTSKELTTAEIYAKYVNSCVGITVDIVSTNVFGQTVTGAAAGSGFVITEDGYILTNYHVTGVGDEPPAVLGPDRRDELVRKRLTGLRAARELVHEREDDDGRVVEAGAHHLPRLDQLLGDERLVRQLV